MDIYSFPPEGQKVNSGVGADAEFLRIDLSNNLPDRHSSVISNGELWVSFWGDHGTDVLSRLFDVSLGQPRLSTRRNLRGSSSRGYRNRAGVRVRDGWQAARHGLEQMATNF